MSGRLAQLRAAGQLLCVPRPWAGPSAGATRTRSSACGSPGVPERGQPRRADPSGSWGLGGGGGGAERSAGVRTWAPLAMAAKVDLSTSTDWKEAKCKCKQEGSARGEGAGQHPTSSLFHPRDPRKLRPRSPNMDPSSRSHAPRVPSPANHFTPYEGQVPCRGQCEDDLTPPARVTGHAQGSSRTYLRTPMCGRETELISQGH